jgi:hypothetical protein
MKVDQVQASIEDRVDRATEAFGALHKIDLTRDPGPQGSKLLADLLADLMHWCEAMGVPLDAALNAAFAQYKEDVSREETVQALSAPTISAVAPGESGRGML